MWCRRIVGPAAQRGDEVDKELGKDALLPGQTASYANYTAYDKGINGVMVDVYALPHLEQLDIEVTTTEELPLCEKEVAELRRKSARIFSSAR